MLLATVESVGFNFRIVVFTRDYDQYVGKLNVDQIVVADGRLRFDNERGEISLSPGEGFGKKGTNTGNPIKSFTITQFHDFARQAGVRFKHDERVLEYQKQEHYTIDVPPFWGRSDLLELKDFLAEQPTGMIEVFIRIKGIEKSTKFSIAKKEPLESWLKDRV